MSTDYINHWQSLPDEEFIHVSRYIRQEFTTQLDRDYIISRLKQLGYTIVFGCCGVNQLRMFIYE